MIFDMIENAIMQVINIMPIDQFFKYETLLINNNKNIADFMEFINNEYNKYCNALNITIDKRVQF